MCVRSFLLLDENVLMITSVCDTVDGFSPFCIEKSINDVCQKCCFKEVHGKLLSLTNNQPQ